MYKISHEKIRVWAEDFFGRATIEVRVTAFNWIHLIIETRNLSMTAMEKFARWFWKEYGVTASKWHISGSPMLSMKTAFLIQIVLPLFVEDSE